MTVPSTDSGPGDSGGDGTDDGDSSGDDGDSSGDGADSSGDGSDSSGGKVELVPIPCAQESFDFAEVEPNDTPSQATDACTVANGYWGTFAGPTSIGGDDELDYVVFRTPAAGMNVDVPVIPCWNTPTDLIDLSIFEVVDQVAVEPPVYESATPATDCEGEFGISLAPDTVFLLELRLATPGAAEDTYDW